MTLEELTRDLTELGATPEEQAKAARVWKSEETNWLDSANATPVERWKVDSALNEQVNRQIATQAIQYGAVLQRELLPDEAERQDFNRFMEQYDFDPRKFEAAMQTMDVGSPEEETRLKRWAGIAHDINDATAKPEFKPVGSGGVFGDFVLPGANRIGSASVRKTDSGFEALVTPLTGEPFLKELPDLNTIRRDARKKAEQVSVGALGGIDEQNEDANTWLRVASSNMRPESIAKVRLLEELRDDPRFTEGIPNSYLEQFSTKAGMKALMSFAGLGEAAVNAVGGEGQGIRSGGARELTENIAPGTLRANFEKNYDSWQETVSDAESSLLTLLGGSLAARGAMALPLRARGLAAPQQATAFTALGGQATGAQYSDLLQQADDKQAAGDREGAARIRKWALINAVGSGLAETGSEMLFPETAFLTGGKTNLKTLAAAPLIEGVEETASAIAQRPGADLTGTPYESLSHAFEAGAIGSAAFAPMLLGSVVANRRAALPASPTQTAAQTAQQSGMDGPAQILAEVAAVADARIAETTPGSTLTAEEFDALSPDLPVITAPAPPVTPTANEEDQRQREAQLLNEESVVAPSAEVVPASPAEVALQPETSRPTRHRVFEGGSPIRVSGEGVLQAPDETMAYRVTGQDQIDDILQTGEVRAREGKMKGGRTGETQWSRGNERLGYKAEGNEGRYLIETPAEGLNDRQGGLPVSEVSRVWKAENGQWVDVTPQIKPAAAIGPQFAALEAEVTRRLGPEFVEQARTQEPARAMSALRAAFPDVAEENLQAFADELVSRAAVETPVTTSDIAAGTQMPAADQRRFPQLDLNAARQRLQQATQAPAETQTEEAPLDFRGGILRDDGVVATLNIDGKQVSFFRPDEEGGAEWYPWNETEDSAILNAAAELNNTFGTDTANKDVIEQMHNMLLDKDAPRKLAEIEQSLTNLYGDQFETWPESERQAIRDYARSNDESDLKKLPFAKRQTVKDARVRTIRFSPQSLNPQQYPTGTITPDVVQTALTNFRQRIGAPLPQVVVLSKAEAAEQFPDVAVDPRFENGEGFYVDGQVVIMPDGIGLRPGETPESAATRVILHETAGHLGLRDALGKWEAEVESALLDLQRSVPALKGKSLQEVEEYFARKIENGKIPKDGVLLRVWNAVRDALRRIFGMDRIPNENQIIRELFDRSIESLRSGIPEANAYDTAPSPPVVSSPAPAGGERVRSRSVVNITDPDFLPVLTRDMRNEYAEATALLNNISPDPFIAAQTALATVASTLNRAPGTTPDTSTPLSRALATREFLWQSVLHAVSVQMNELRLTNPGNQWLNFETRNLLVRAQQMYRQKLAGAAAEMSAAGYHINGLKDTENQTGVPALGDFAPLLTLWGVNLDKAQSVIKARLGATGSQDIAAAVNGASDAAGDFLASALTSIENALDIAQDESDLRIIKQMLGGEGSFSAFSAPGSSSRKAPDPTKIVKARSKRIVDSLVPLPPKAKNAVSVLINKHEKTPIADFVPQLEALGVERDAAALLEQQMAEIRIGKRQADALAGYPRLKSLVQKMFSRPGGAPKWTDIFRGLHGSSRSVERTLISQLQKHESFAGLPRAERMAVVEDLRNLFTEQRKKASAAAIRQLNPGKSAADRKKVEDSIPKLMQLLELGGVLTDDTVAKAMSEKFGVRTLTPADEAKALTIWEDMRKLKNPYGVLYNRKMDQLIQLIADITHVPRAKIIGDWIMRSILAAGGTLVSILFGGILGAAEVMVVTPIYSVSKNIARGNAATAARIIGTLPRMVTHVFRAFWAGGVYLIDGDTSALTRYTEGGASAYTEGDAGPEILKSRFDSKEIPIRTLDLRWDAIRKSNAFLGPGMLKNAGANFMVYAGRLIQAMDMIVRVWIQKVGLDQQLAERNPEMLEKIRNPDAKDKEAAYDQARLEIFGPGVSDSFVVRNNPAVKQRMIELLGFETGTPEQQASYLKEDMDAEQLSKVITMQGRPQGVSKLAYELLLAPGRVAKIFGDNLGGLFQYAAEGRTSAIAAKSLQFIGDTIQTLGEMAPLVFGTKFARAVVGMGTAATRYIPGTAPIRYGLQWIDKIAGESMSKTAGFRLFDYRNPKLDQYWGMSNLMGALGYAALWAFTSKDDDDEGAIIEGSWSEFSPQEKKARYAAGFSPYSIRWREKDGKLVKIGYTQSPFRVVLAAVGAAREKRINRPDAYNENSTWNHITSAVLPILSATKDVAALDSFQKLISANPFATPEEKEMDFILRVNANVAQTVTGIFPRSLKDLDTWMDANTYSDRSLLGQWERGVPFWRRKAGDGEPDLSIFGRPIELSAAPWRRFYKEFIPKDTAETNLVDLIGRGVKIPVWPDVSKGSWSQEDAQGSIHKVPDKIAQQIALEQGQTLARLIGNFQWNGPADEVSKELSEAATEEWQAIRENYGVKQQHQ